MPREAVTELDDILKAQGQSGELRGSASTANEQRTQAGDQKLSTTNVLLSPSKSPPLGWTSYRWRRLSYNVQDGFAIDGITQPAG